MHPRAEEFTDRAREEYGLDLTPEEFPEGTKTAEDAAAALGCDVAQIASSIVFHVAMNDTGGDAGLAVVVTSGVNRVSEAKLADLFGVDEDAVSTASPDEIRETVGWSIGGVPPFCHDSDVPTYLDRTLLEFDTVWAAAGTPQAVFPIDPETLRATSEARVVDVFE